TGFAFFRNRWYDPSTGSWLTPDPLGNKDSSNLYAFCGGDPVNCSDPSGESGWDPASWGHSIDAGAKFVKRKIGAASIALAGRTGNRALDEGIDFYVGSVE